MRFHINTGPAVIFTNKLEKMHKSALPSAIRGSLNDVAYDAKTKTIPYSAAKIFVNRTPNFFKVYSKFDKAQGFDVNNMRSMVGFVSDGLSGSNNFAVKDLEQQEYGGTIKGRSFVPMRSARKGGTGAVKPSLRISKIKRIIKTKSFKGNTGQKFIQSIAEAGTGGFVLSGKKNVLFKVNSVKVLNFNVEARSHLLFKITPVYKFKKKGAPKVKHTLFMQKATLQSAEKINYFYIQQATRQINKLR